MKHNQLFRYGFIEIIRVSIIFVFLLTSITLYAQTPTNYSGKWEFDKTNSILDRVEPNYEGTIILEITQNATTITFIEVYKQPGSPDFKSAPESYKLDGKEQIKTSDIGTNKNSAKWSADKRVLTITNTDTQTLDGALKDFIVIDNYKLSDDKKTLTIERYRKNPVTGETKSKKVYVKK
ncbi:MAG: hypothetical protein AB9846_11460 [Tenuifilaceae bacterium]